MSDPREHLGRVRRQFTRQADAYSDMPQTNDAARAEALAAFTGVQPHHDVLDVACGPGFLTAALATRCGSALGVDATPALIERARRHAAQNGIVNLRFQLGDAEALPFADDAFDLVLPSLPGVHPRMASDSTGPRPTRMLEPPGFLALNYGYRTPMAVLIAHIAYGMVLGTFYQV